MQEQPVNSQALINVLDTKWSNTFAPGNAAEGGWRDVLEASETLLWKDMDGGNFSNEHLTTYGVLGVYKDNNVWNIMHLGGSVSVHLSRDIDDRTTSVSNDKLEFSWRDDKVEEALLGALEP